jgi:cytochrome c oxidase subunit 3/cytochrome o ubiquinol oxidase subunit 3
MNTTFMTTPNPELNWELPARGRTAMFCLIAAESAIFTIFVVAYLFYIGKSLTGPMPKDVLTAPIFYTICLLSSSLTIHLAVGALRRGNIGTFGTWWLGTLALGATFLYGTAIVMGFTLLGSVKQTHVERAEVLSLYWHFVDAVWVVVFLVVYVIGR